MKYVEKMCKFNCPNFCEGSRFFQAIYSDNIKATYQVIFKVSCCAILTALHVCPLCYAFNMGRLISIIIMAIAVIMPLLYVFSLQKRTMETVEKLNI